MRRTILVCGLTLFIYVVQFLIVPSTFAQQITITKADVDAQFVRQQILQEFRISTDNIQSILPEIQAIIDSQGENLTWDFSSFPFVSDPSATTIQVTPPVRGTRNPKLESPDYVTRYDVITGNDSTVYTFMDVDSSGVRWLGLYYPEGIEDFFVSEGEMAFDTALTHLILPLSYGQTWTDSTMATPRLEPSLPFIRIEADVMVLDTTWVEGWGMLITPVGSQPALKVRKTRTENWHVTGTIDLDTSRRYSTLYFLSTGDLSARIDLDESGNFVSAAYIVNPATVAAEEEPVLPTSILLEQNYPNPFNPSTQIAFTLPAATHVNLSIYDLLGKRVDVILDGLQPSGRHTIDWRADRLPSGTYIYRLETRFGVSSRTMTLLK